MNLKRLIERHFDVIPDRCHGDELVFICGSPCPDTSGNRSVNLKNKKTSCWRCQKGGSIFSFLRQRGIALDDLDEDIGDAWEVDSLLKAKDETRLPFLKVDLPAGFEPLKGQEGTYYYRLIKNMAERKNLTIEDFIKAGVGFTREDRKWEPYAIFPVKEWGQTVYYQGRTFNDIPGEPTKRFPNRNDLPFGAKYWLYNIDRARDAGTPTSPIKLILVESILNVISLEKELKYRNLTQFVPIALFKHAISREQRMKLKTIRHVDEICLMFDSDATEDSKEIAQKLPTNLPITIVEMPHKVDANDNAEVAVDLLMRRKPAIFTASDEVNSLGLS